MATPIFDRFLQETNNILVQRDGPKLQQYLILEPPYPDIYQDVIREFKQAFPPTRRSQLDDKLERLLPDYEGDSGGAWNGFRIFLTSWLDFISNVEAANLLKTHGDLIVMLRQSQIALGDNTNGIVMLPTTLFYAHTLAKFTIFLEKQPELLVKAQQKMRDDAAVGGGGGAGGGGDDDGQATLASTTARVIIEALKKCINERLAPANGGVDQHGKPAGRRVGIYILANICLKLLTRARQYRSAETIFTQIRQLSPPLARFPKAQQVTYLYYLGRYHFSNNHFLRAAAALQGAYGSCPARFTTQRYHILIFLLASNLVVGRLPGPALFDRPEAAGALARHFRPFAHALRSGDLPLFRRLTSIDLIDVAGTTPRFFLVHGILLQLANRCETLVMRSLARRVFSHAGFHGSEGSKAAPNLDLSDLRAVVVGLERRATAAAKAADPNHVDLATYVDPDFDGLDGEELNYMPYAVYEEDVETDAASNAATADGGTDVVSARDSPTMPEVEMLVASLVRQGLLHGFVSHKHAKFVISGAKNKDPVAAGFPTVWDVVKLRREPDVIGWVTDENCGQARRGGVVRLSGATAVGVPA